MNHSLKENLITTKDASELSGYTSDYLARLVRSGEIQGKRIGHSWVISSASLETFMTKQKGRKLDRARELASSRVREYNKHNQFVQRTTRALTEKISVPKFRLEEVSLRSHSLALGVALVVVALGAVGANAAALPQVAQRASALATEISSGFVDTFGDVPTRIAVRMEEARIAVRADATRNALASRRAGYVASPVLASIDLETLRTVLVKEYRAPRATSDIAFSSSRADTPILTVTDVYTSAASAYAFFANPSNIGTTLTDAYFAIGTDAYAAVDASFSAYRTLIDASGTPMLAAAATTRDALAHTPRLVAQVNLALGEAVIKATHAAIRTDVIAAHGLAAAAPESARIAVTLMGSTGDTLARAAEQVPARVATAYLNATAVPAVLAPRLAQAVFNAEYAVADRFVSATNAVSGRYLALVEGTGSIAYESSTNARSIVQSASRTIAFAPAALEDVTLGTLGKSAAALDSVTHLSSFAAVLPALSASEKTALAVYEAIHSAFDSANRTLVAFFTTTPETVLPTGVPKARVIAVATSTRPVSSGTQPVTTLSYPTYTTVVRGVSEDFVNQSLASLRTNVLATVAGMIQPVSSQVVQNITTIQQLNRIDSLHDLVVQNGDFRNSIFDNGIRVNARDGYFDNLTAGTTTLATTTVNGTLTVSSLTLTGSLSSPGSITGSHFVSTSTNATSTFAGSINVDNAGFVYATSTRNVGIGVLSPAALLAVQNSTSTQPIFVASNAAGAEVYRLTNDGFVGIGTTSPTYNLAVEGSSTLGNQAIAGYFTATTTTATSTFAGSFTVGTDKLVVNSTTGNIGIGTTSPYQRLSVAGNVIADTFIATSTTATSTFAGGFAVETDGLVYDYSSNNVGIGTAGPVNAKLDIRESASGAYGIKLTNRNATRTWGIATDVGAVNDNKFGIFDVTSGGARLTIDTSGYVGIGSTSPAQKLVVSGNILTDNANNNLSAYNIINRPTNATYDAANWYQTAGVSKWIAGLLAASSGGTANADDYSIAYYNGSWNNAVTINNSGRVGIGTTSPSGTLAVSGDFFLTGSTTITGADSGIVFTGSGNHDITAAGGTLRIGTNTIIGNIEALNDTVDIGTAVTRFDKIYANEVNASTIVGTLTGGNLSAETFTINSDNATADTENAYLAFERGTITPNATLSWNAAENAKRFELNHPLFIQNASASTTLTTFDLKSVAGQTADILRVASSSSDTLFNVTASGNVGVGTTSPFSRLSVTGAGVSTGRGFSVADSSNVDNFFVLDNGNAYMKGSVGVGTTSPWGLLSVNPNGITGPAFVVGSSTATNFIVTNGGNVGVGTTNPTSKFEIFGTHGLPATSGTTVTAEAVIGGSTNSVLYMGTAPVSPYGAWLQVSDRSSLGINYPLLLNPNGGNVGIGSTSPMSKLSVVGESRITGVDSTFGDNANARTSLHINANTGALAELAYESVGSLRWKVGKNSTTESGSNVGSDFYFNRRSDTGTDLGTAMLIQRSTGNVGIGTTTPGAKLDVYGGTTQGIHVNTTNESPYALLINNNTYGTANSSGFGFYQDNNGTGRIWNNNVSSVAIDTTGEVGIGTTSPSNLLHTQKNWDGATRVQITNENTGVGSQAGLYVTNSATANYYFTAGLMGTGFTTSGLFAQNKGVIAVGSQIDGLNIFTQKATAPIIFGTGGGAAANERMRITETGSVGIGTTTPVDILNIYSASTNRVLLQADTSTGYAEYSLSADQGRGSRSTLIQYGSAHATLPNALQLLNFNNADLALGTNNTRRMTISGSGLVGIGTTSPNNNLHVYSTTNAGGITIDGTTNPALTLKVNNVAKGFLGVATANDAYITGVVADDIVMRPNAAAGRMVFGSASTLLPILTLSPSGYVGIGTSTPERLLQVHGTNTEVELSSGADEYARLYFKNGDGTGEAGRKWLMGQYGGTAGNPFVFTYAASTGSNWVDALAITNTGYVGIGTTNPAQKLSVLDGNILATTTSAGGVLIGGNGFSSFTGNPLIHGGIQFTNQFGSTNWIGESNGSTQLQFGSGATANMVLQAGVLTLPSATAQLGVGTTTPWGALSASSTSAYPTLAIEQKGAGAAATFLGGNVGIGTTSPVSKLSVVGESALAGGLSVGLGYAGTAAPSNGLIIQGNVGIGTTNPAAGAKLEVNGQLKVDGDGNVAIAFPNSEAIRTGAAGTTAYLDLGKVYIRNGDGGIGGVTQLGVAGGLAVGSTYGNSNTPPADGAIIQGNVGIGTTSPGAKLDVRGVVNFGDQTVQGGSGQNQWAKFYGSGLDSGGTNYGNFGGFVFNANANLNSGSRKFLVTNALDYSKFAIIRSVDATTEPSLGTLGAITSGTADFVINNLGNVGIGTTSPTHALEVWGGAAPQLYAAGIAGNYGFIGLKGFNAQEWQLQATTGGDFYISEGQNTPRVIVKPTSGNVGIGTTSPVSKLSVVGESALAGGLSVGLGYAGTAAPSNGLIIQGNVGIGTTGPGSTLDVRAAAATSNLQSTTGTNSVVLHLNNNAGTHLGTESSAGGAILTGSTAYSTVLYNDSARSLHLGTNNAVKMTIDSTGNVGIGTTAPGSALDINVGNVAQASETTGLIIRGSKVSAGDNFNLGLEFRASDINITNRTVAKILAIKSDSTLGNSSLAFSTEGGAVLGERMRIDNLGNVGIGTTSPWGQFSVNPNGIAGPAFVVGSSTATNFIVTNGGNVGVGLTNPDEALTILVNSPSQIGGVKIKAQLPLVDFVDLNATGNYRTAVENGSYYIEDMTTAGFPERLVITSAGNVGIGTTNPGANLEVYGNNPAIRIHDGAAAANNWDLQTVQARSGEFEIHHVSDDKLPFVIDTSGNINIGSSATGLPLNPPLYVQNGGNVGIGTTSPTEKLHVYSDASGSTKIGSLGGAAGSAGIQFLYLSQAYGRIFGDASDNSLKIEATYANSNPIEFFTGGSERVRITSAGNVGIGTTAPGHNLAVYSANGVDMYLGHDNTSGTFPKVSAFGLGSNAVSYGYANNGGTLTVTGSAQIAAIQSQSSGAETALAFYTTTGGSVQERMRILNSGNVGIGTTSPGAKLHVSDGTGSGVTPYAFARAVLDSANYTYLDLNGGATSAAGVNFGKAGVGSQRGSVEYDFGNDFMRFITASGERLRITSAGNVGIGTTNPASKLNVWQTVAGKAYGATVSYAGGVGSSWYTDGSNISGIGADDNQSFALRTSDTNRLTILTGGNVGIGTTTPADILHVFKSDSSSIKLDSSTGNSVISFARNNVNKGLLSLVGTTDNVVTGSVLNDLAIRSSQKILISADDGTTAHLVILNNGNVGIGTTSPVSKLSVVGESALAGGLSVGLGYAGTAAPSNGLIIQGNVGIGTTGPTHKLQIVGANNATELKVSSADQGSGAIILGDGASSLKNVGMWRGNANSYVANGNWLNFGTYGDGGFIWATGNAELGSQTERMRLDAATGLVTIAQNLKVSGAGNSSFAGNVGIGTTSPATKLEVGGNTANVTFDGYLNCAGFTSDANGKLACTASDQRLKQSITSLATSSVLTGINALNPVSFIWRDPSMGSQQQFGLIAQQVQEVFPNLVQMTNPTELTPDGTLTVNYPGFISPMILAIQELDARTRQILGSGGVLSIAPGVESQCVAGDTRLRRRRRRADGSFELDEVDIKDIAAGDEIQSLDERTGRVVYSRVNALIDMGEQEVYELVTKSGRRIRTTANHPYLARERATNP